MPPKLLTAGALASGGSHQIVAQMTGNPETSVV